MPYAALSMQSWESWQKVGTCGKPTCSNLELKAGLEGFNWVRSRVRISRQSRRGSVGTAVELISHGRWGLASLIRDSI